MNDPPGPSEGRQTTQRTGSDGDRSSGVCSAVKSFSPPLLCPSDPARQAKRLPVRILKMLTAHTGHLLHPEYLQPLTSAPVSIELDAKKSPLALLAQTCSQIGKPDPPPSSKLSSLTSGGLGDKEPVSRSSTSALKVTEQHQPLDDKSSFKPYSKVSGECRKDPGGAGGSTEKGGFRVPSTTGAGPVSAPPFAPHTLSPNSRVGSPPQRPQSQTPPSQQTQHPQALHLDSKPPGAEPSNSESSGGVKKEAEPCKSNLEGAQLANSSSTRASANGSSGSSAGSPHHEGKVDVHAPPSGLSSGHVAPVSPFKPGHSVFPLPPSSMGYHGSIVGAYAGYPSQFVSGLDHTKSSLVGGGIGVPGKHPSSSPLTGASPPSFMQGLCRDPYCLAYSNAPHLGGNSCSSCIHDPSALKSQGLHTQGFPLVYPSHPLHPLHPSSLSSSGTPSLSHPLYSYGFMLPNEPHPHACNWVSAGGPCDKRFATSDELLTHLRTHTALPGIDGKLLSAYPSSVSSASSCHLHLPPPGSPGSFSLRAPPSLGLSRYHPYSKAHLPASASLPVHSLPAAAAPYYSPYALYSQRLGSASALGYQ
ncbi:zinc finger protein 703-like [Paramormyrops kingsleyae]|uniref:Zinc finger protein 703 n=1 Tax=Paramormyrops kingsleyae TaxID=1676925 RepID=A0A3B3QAD9_9TELE|nr:zinc finger protein 703-like isoform X1 [Paramormyrops kingsleyae]XP_023676539.1 zinc finger protein 703-like isoform X1 [Paramormyrops kingsleyae]